MLGKLSTLIVAISCLVAMVAAILGEGPFWVRAIGAVAISVLLVAGALINGTAKEAIDRIDSFLREVEEERPTAVGIIRVVDEDDDDSEDIDSEDPGFH